MNKVLTILLSVLSLFATISCGKELDVTENIVTGFVTLWTDSNGNISVLEDDFGKRFMVDDRDGTKEPADTVLRVISMYIVNADSTTATVLETINILSNRATDICECAFTIFALLTAKNYVRINENQSTSYKNKNFLLCRPNAGSQRKIGLFHLHLRSGGK